MNTYRLPQSVRVACAAFAGLVSWSLAEDARAFCRTTTCDKTIEEGGCPVDRNGCQIEGIPLFWPDTCVTFGTHTDGSPLRNISYERADTVAQRAFQSWISADCGADRRPSIGVVPRGEVICDQVEFNHEPPAPNANLIVFRDTLWPYDDNQRTIALTTITFAVRTGEILDADIEVNSASIPLSTSDTNISSDLQSVLTHEIGHFLGLAHSREPTASMNANYDRGDLSFRSLSADDIAGVCAIYPPGETEVGECRGEAPRNGFSRYCGNPVQADAGCFCGVVGGQTPRSEWPVALAFAGVAWLLYRRRQ